MIPKEMKAIILIYYLVKEKLLFVRVLIAAEVVEGVAGDSSPMQPAGFVRQKIA